MRFNLSFIKNVFNIVKMLQAPAAERNKDAILSVLKLVLSVDRPLNGLEIASGTGQHVSWFAQHLPNITWQPSEYDESSLKSIAAYIESLSEQAKARVKPPRLVDVTKPLNHWPPEVVVIQQKPYYDFILNINMIHISPYECTNGLFHNGSQLVKDNGLIILYGPFAIDGVLTPESNIAFDKSLRARDSSWGVRDTRDVTATAQQFGFKFIKKYDMPANNKILVYQKTM